MASFIDLSTLHVPTPRSHPPASWGAQIRENDEFLYANRRQVCTSATRPTGVEGLEIFETDTDFTYIYSGSAWVQTGSIGAFPTFTPTLTQTATITKTVTYSAYWRAGRLIVWQFDLALTSAGTAAATILLTLPVTASALNAVQGSFVFQDTGTVNYAGGILPNSTTQVSLQQAGGATHLGASVTIASGDRLYGTVNYQAAS